ncbi:MAG TPA: 16S rRNA (guanine(966)-N(2))-methyltransferase RsmD [Amycolatopsis sp.]|uniref:16S rRNA (guanine(966)-N(2))-methyltransferase RsmD n=1 Tax=Amycolatopsis sp. TaxID=37632 RepID=UPI002B476E5B|nr:16S rRNA (guanine(966)-N(2))-methyltransferase RsmD [Amycolatopsis sp.]HKS44020.1 16S rRNA (guanine(966)-N(2))-methyltransferase RsmD [Amycolatopsis sp.]
MTRIVAGRAGGRRLKVPSRGTRPTSERVREALFNALEAGGELRDARVLDLYAGSGALGLEALSRGASEALFVEADRKAVRVLRENVAEVGLGGWVRAGNVEMVLAHESPAAPFDIVFADPPYVLDGARISAMLTSLAKGGWIVDDGLVVLERSTRDSEPDWPRGYELIRSMRHGDTVMYWAEYVTSAGREG